MPITIGSVTLPGPRIINRRDPTVESEEILLGGFRDQMQETNHGTEFTIECRSEEMSDYYALFTLFGSPHELVLNWGTVEEPDEESMGYFIITTPSLEMPKISRLLPYFVYRFNLKKHTSGS